jgi:hypothetical protein
LSLCGVKRQVAEVFERTGLSAKIGPVNLFRDPRQAIDAIEQRTRPPSAGAGPATP